MSRRHIFLAACALILLTALAYLPVLNGRAGYIWDDNTHVTHNPALHDGQGLIDLWAWGPRAFFDQTVKPATQQYYPVTFSSFWLEYQMWGLQPFGYHLDNVLLHLLSAFLIWIILRHLGFSDGVAFIAAALFAVHPVNVESVAWISERKNTLSLVLYLAAALCWIRWNKLDQCPLPPAAKPTRDFAWLFWACLLFTFALLAKSVTVTLPAALLLIAWYKRGKIRILDLLGTLPLFIIGGIASWITITIETDKHYIGAYGEDFNFGFLTRCLIAGRAVWFYLGSLLDPHKLIFIYPRWQLDPHQAIQWIAPIAVVGVLIALFALRKKITRAPFAVAALFIISLAPALGFINFYPMQFSFVADHFQYIATIPICIGLAVLFALLARRVHIPAIFAGLPLLALTILAYSQSTMYHDEQTLYRVTLAKNPDAWMASENLAVLLVAEDPTKNYPEVVRLYRQTLDKNPRDAKAQSALAGTLLAMRRFPEAEAAYHRALDLTPGAADLEGGLGAALLLQNKYDEAAAYYTLAAARASSNPEYFAGEGNALLHAGHPAEAEPQFRAAIALHTGDIAFYQYCLGLALRDEGRLGPALDAFHTSIKLNPQRVEPFVESADILARLHEDGLAIEHFQSALHLQPDYIPAQVDLARLLLITDDPTRADPVWAADLFRQADEETHGTNLSIKVERAGALAAGKFYDQAIDLLQQVIDTFTPAQLPPTDRELVLQLLAKYQIAASPVEANAAAHGAPVAHPDENSIFQAYPASPVPTTQPSLRFIPPPVTSKPPARRP
jgi:tetratricopeptide (TPR) repeat protein